MPRVNIYVSASDQHVELDCAEGMSMMKLAVANDVPGIIGECGGELSCGTCHVIVADEWASRIEPASDEESGMLEVLDNLQPNSRLCCQIMLREPLDGISVTVPNA